MDLQKEREAFEAVTNIYHCIYNADLNYYFSGSQFVGNKAEIAVNAGWKAWQAAKAQAVPAKLVLELEKGRFKEYEVFLKQYLNNGKSFIDDLNWAMTGKFRKAVMMNNLAKVA